MLKRFVKRIILSRRGIILDKDSDINYSCEFNGEGKCRIVNSNVHINRIGEGCFIEKATIYGDVELGSHVNISGPGTIIHSEINKITIGSFSSIAPNVTIIEFNHDMNRVTTSTIQANLFGKTPQDDFISKGPIMIGEDVWIGANVVILSGVKIGRGAIIAAGSVVNKDVEPYAIYGGVPAKKIKNRFSPEKIKRLEDSQWWTWSEETIRKEREFFLV